MASWCGWSILLAESLFWRGSSRNTPTSRDDDSACSSMYPHHARIVHSVLPHEILDDATSEDPSFIDTSRGPNVHLRNFKIQIARYATISDIVVYGCDAHAVATRIVNAQTKLREKRIKEKGNDSLLEYRVLMIQGITSSSILERD